eukprot:TRINITY_DN10106_c0_g1_i1.p1 TRINITY_DN10106_c0_g1~~TRINITY_DN10106_c0_g1_i1.p1  ORF type:complete len:252 (+),score=48.94 TRINITY_DN10106_c0_g1_i1:137-892(+)
MCSMSEDIFVKIGDFDLAALIDQVDNQKIVGTPGYISPEVYSHAAYSTKSDVYAAGVVLYTILTGEFPFKPKEAKSLFFLRKNAPFYFDNPRYSNISQEARDLILLMLSQKPEDRPEVSDVLQSEWIKLGTAAYLKKLHASSESCLFEDDDDIYTMKKDSNIFIKSKYEIPKEALNKLTRLKSRSEDEESKARFAKSREVCAESSNYAQERTMSRDRTSIRNITMNCQLTRMTTTNPADFKLFSFEEDLDS